MKIAYDQYYQTKNLFGQAYPELLDFFSGYPKRGFLLDLGCGQGRDAIPLARLGYQVTGIDHSKVGIEQMNEVAQKEKLNLVGIVADIYQYNEFSAFDFILLDSLFHFTKKDRSKEMALIQRVLEKSKPGSLVVICIQDTGNKVDLLQKAIDGQGPKERIFEKKLDYQYLDRASGHSSMTQYQMIVVRN